MKIPEVALSEQQIFIDSANEKLIEITSTGTFVQRKWKNIYIAEQHLQILKKRFRLFQSLSLQVFG